jgi:hypothetical protein
MGKAILILFAIMQGIAVLLGMINAGDWNIGRWDAGTRNAVATIPVTIMIILILMYFSGSKNEKEGK